MGMPDNALRYGAREAPPPGDVAVLVPDLYVGADENGFLRVYRFREPIANTTKEPNP